MHHAEQIAPEARAHKCEHHGGLAPCYKHTRSWIIVNTFLVTIKKVALVHLTVYQ